MEAFHHQQIPREFDEIPEQFGQLLCASLDFASLEKTHVTLGPKDQRPRNQKPGMATAPHIDTLGCSFMAMGCSAFCIDHNVERGVFDFSVPFKKIHPMHFRVLPGASFILLLSPLNYLL